MWYRFPSVQLLEKEQVDKLIGAGNLAGVGSNMIAISFATAERRKQLIRSKGETVTLWKLDGPE